MRNRIKRQVREYFRRHRGDWLKSSDVLIIARNSAATLANALIVRELDQALAKQRRQSNS